MYSVVYCREEKALSLLQLRLEVQMFMRVHVFVLVLAIMAKDILVPTSHIPPGSVSGDVLNTLEAHFVRRSIAFALRNRCNMRIWSQVLLHWL